jgi:hypothetical protein
MLEFPSLAGEEDKVRPSAADVAAKIRNEERSGTRRAVYSSSSDDELDLLPTETRSRLQLPSSGKAGSTRARGISAIRKGMQGDRYEDSLLQLSSDASTLSSFSPTKSPRGTRNSVMSPLSRMESLSPNVLRSGKEALIQGARLDRSVSATPTGPRSRKDRSPRIESFSSLPIAGGRGIKRVLRAGDDDAIGLEKRNLAAMAKIDAVENPSPGVRAMLQVMRLREGHVSNSQTALICSPTFLTLRASDSCLPTVPFFKALEIARSTTAGRISPAHMKREMPSIPIPIAGMVLWRKAP